MIRAIVFGAHGFTARYLIPRLVETEAAQVVAVDVPLRPPAWARVDAYISRDIGDLDFVRRLVSDYKPDWVFNLAAVTQGSPADIYRTNFTGPINILEAVREAVAEARVLLVGSAAEYGRVEPDRLPLTEQSPCNPVGDYGISKHAMTLAAVDLVRRFGLKVVIARPFNLVGAGVPASLVVGAVLARAREALSKPGEPVVKVGNLDTQRDFVAVQDAVDAYVAMIKCGLWGEVFNICSGKPVSIRRVVEMALSHAPKPVRLVVDPKLVRPADSPVVYGSPEKARKAFGFQPSVTLEESLRRAWAHSHSGE